MATTIEIPSNFEFRSVIIKNLPEIITKDMFGHIFPLLTFGNVLSCKIAKDEEGLSKGIGFINFTSVKAATKFIGEYNLMEVYGKQIKIQTLHKFYASEDIFRGVLLLRIKNSVTCAQLFNKFKEFGEIVDFKFLTHQNFQLTMRSCYVIFNSVEVAINARNYMKIFAYINENPFMLWYTDGSYFKKCRVEVEKFACCHRYDGYVLNVRNLKSTITENDLKIEFAPFGQIKSIKIFHVFDRHYGYIRFASMEAANNAIFHLGRKHRGSNLMQVSLADCIDNCKIYFTKEFKQIWNIEDDSASNQFFQIPDTPEQAEQQIDLIPKRKKKERILKFMQFLTDKGLRRMHYEPSVFGPQPIPILHVRQAITPACPEEIMPEPVRREAQHLPFAENQRPIYIMPPDTHPARQPIPEDAVRNMHFMRYRRTPNREYHQRARMQNIISLAMMRMRLMNRPSILGAEAQYPPTPNQIFFRFAQENFRRSAEQSANGQRMRNIVFVRPTSNGFYQSGPNQLHTLSRLFGPRMPNIPIRDGRYSNRFYPNYRQEAPAQQMPSTSRIDESQGAIRRNNQQFPGPSRGASNQRQNR